MAKWWERAYLKPLGAHYYGGVVDDLDDILEVHRRETLSTFGTRTSVKNIIIRNDENVPPAGKSEKVCCIAII